MSEALSSLEAERWVLGAVLATPVTLEALRPVLSPEDFADARHAHVFRAMLGLANRHVPVDHVTLSEELRSAGLLTAVGGPAALMALDEGVGFPAAAVEHARTVRDYAIRRGAVRVARESAARAADLSQPVDAVLSTGAREWAGLTHAVRGVKSGRELVLSLVETCERVQLGQEETCLPTGIDRWDEVFGGLQPAKLTFIGSQPGVGKSSLLATMVENLCSRGRRVGFFSLEDAGDWIARRVCSKRSSIPLFVLANRKLTETQMERLNEGAASTHEALQNLFVDDRSMLTPSQIVQSARDLIVNRGVEVLFLDHLGKVDFESKKHHAHDLAIEHGLNELTALAKDYRVPVVVAAHLKEREEDAKYQRPHLESFARTAFIGRDARVAVGLYLVKGEPDVLRVAVLKQTEGEGDGVFELSRLQECGLVSSFNGALNADRYAEAEKRMLGERSAA